MNARYNWYNVYKRKDLRIHIVHSHRETQSIYILKERMWQKLVTPPWRPKIPHSGGGAVSKVSFTQDKQLIRWPWDELNSENFPYFRET